MRASSSRRRATQRANRRQATTSSRPTATQSRERTLRPVGRWCCRGGRRGGRSRLSTLTAHAATKARAAPRLSRAVSTPATPSVISRTARPSLWGPPTTWTRTRGLRATKAAARVGSMPRAGARRATRYGDGQDGGGRGRLEDVDGGVDRQPGERVGRQGEERAVGAGGFGPGDVGEGGVRGDARRAGGRRGRGRAGRRGGRSRRSCRRRGRAAAAGRRRATSEDDDRRPDQPPPEPGRPDEHAEVGGEAGPHQAVGNPRREAQLFAPGFFGAHRHRRRPPRAGEAGPASVPGPLPGA